MGWLHGNQRGNGTRRASRKFVDISTPSVAIIARKIDSVSVGHPTQGRILLDSSRVQHLRFPHAGRHQTKLIQGYRRASDR
jgi:hypothetical protein